jgi:hypothetical protein
MKEPYSCAVANPIDLALALIASKRSDNAVRALAAVLKYQLDGSAASDYACHVLEKGAHIRLHLSRLDAGSLGKECETELEVLVKKHRELFSGVSIQAICAPKNRIETERQDLLKAIAAKRRCEPGW